MLYHLNVSILLLLHDFKWPPGFPSYVLGVTGFHLTHLLLVDVTVFTFWGQFTTFSSAPGTPNEPSNIC